MAGSGAQNDPYIVDTYAELVTKAALGGYIKIGSNINITDEYPEGDMPPLLMANCDIDGDGKTVSNWYYTSNDWCIETTDSNDTISKIHDMNISNIYITGTATAFCKRAEDNNGRAFFENCNIRGKTTVPITSDSSMTLRFKSCSLKCDLTDRKPFGQYGGVFDNCYVIFESGYTANFFSDLLVKTGKDSYFELSLPSLAANSRLDAHAKGFDNCVLDVTSNASFNVGGGTSAVSIIHGGHAPNATADGTNVKKVPASEWLDVTVLHDTYGFNAG